MSTEIILEPRRSGKTTKAIKVSAETGYHILVSNRTMAKSIRDTAQHLNLKIPSPLTYSEWMAIKYLDGTVRPRRVIVDEGLILLESILGANIRLITMSEREEEEVLDENQQLVLNYLKEKYQASKFQAVYFMSKVEKMLDKEEFDSEVNMAYVQLKDKEFFEVLQSFAQWGIREEGASID